jgi:hypothetical protein
MGAKEELNSRQRALRMRLSDTEQPARRRLCDGAGFLVQRRDGGKEGRKRQTRRLPRKYKYLSGFRN